MIESRVYVIRHYPSGYEYAHVAAERAIRFMIDNPSGNPVIFVHHHAAVEYCERMNTLKGIEMTKKDYIKIAECFHGEVRYCQGDSDVNWQCRYTLRGLAKKIADVFKADNPRFDRDRFEAACGFRED